MRTISVIGAALLAGAATTPTLAGTNDLFEAKTATKAIEETTVNVITNATSAERKSKKSATKANQKVLTAYRKCPSKPHKARRALEQAVRKLDRYLDAIADVSTPSDELSALASFAEATNADIEALLQTDTVCDEGHTLTQADDLSYTIDPAPFVNFAPAWGTFFSSAHGTFGDFAPNATAPDHIHSQTYYGVVISGIVKNPFGETPGGAVDIAESLPAGSFWSVPANAIHTTACRDGDANCLFYFHSRGAFDFDTDISGGEPVDDSAQELSVEEIAAKLAEPQAIVSPFARMYTLWGDRSIGAHGTAAQFTAGGESPSHSHSYSYHGVVLTGTMVNPFLGQPVEEARRLQAGDYWFVPAGVDHVTACVSEQPCTFYFHAEGLFDFILPTTDED